MVKFWISMPKKMGQGPQKIQIIVIALEFVADQFYKLNIATGSDPL